MDHPPEWNQNPKKTFWIQVQKFYVDRFPCDWQNINLIKKCLLTRIRNCCPFQWSWITPISALGKVNSNCDHWEHIYSSTTSDRNASESKIIVIWVGLYTQFSPDFLSKESLHGVIMRENFCVLLISYPCHRIIRSARGLLEGERIAKYKDISRQRDLFRQSELGITQTSLHHPIWKNLLFTGTIPFLDKKKKRPELKESPGLFFTHLLRP